MKKLILKKKDESLATKRIGYKIAYADELNAEQYEAVMHDSGAALVIAGAGTGKTRTLVYRLARLIEDGVQPESILLLTFTRKAASEALRRASGMLDGRCDKAAGGTFHSFALNILRKYSERINRDLNFSVLDQSDSEDVINLIRTQNNYAKKTKRFPQKNTLAGIFSMAINKRETLEEIIREDYPYYIERLDDISEIFNLYEAYKIKHNLMSYDDLLVNLLKLLKDDDKTRKELSAKFKYVMVDEYQDTNRLQRDIVMAIAGENENIMAVGDDAQSIYSFRGADYNNIIFFPESFRECKIYKIEENYRSFQPILNLTNEIISRAAFKYDKTLYTKKVGGELPALISSQTERQQSQFVVQQILELRENGQKLEEMAVLFRSSFNAFDLEIELARAGIPYVKFGGMKFSESSHIKDLIAFFRVLANPKDAVSLQRVLLLHEGIGPTGASKIIEKILDSQGDFSIIDYTTIKRNGDTAKELFNYIKKLDSPKFTVSEIAARFADYYKPLMQNKYDDWLKRQKDVDVFLSISERYKNIEAFLNDMAIDPPAEILNDLEPEDKETEYLTLSTIHSAKGLEWTSVFLIWALEGRFPSAKAADSIDDMEEERRLFYVASTRAKKELYITYPINIYDRESGFVLSRPSRFVDGLSDELIDKYVLAEEEVDPNTNFSNN